MKQRKKTFNDLLDYIESQIAVLRQSPQLYRYIIDGVRNNIFYMASTNEFFTGKYSYDAFLHVLDGGKVSELCKEHHYSLKRLCNDIMYSNLSRVEISNMIKSKATFNLTTKDENQLLKKNRQSYERSEIGVNTFSDWIDGYRGKYPTTETEWLDLVPDIYVDWVEENRDKRFW